MQPSIDWNDVVICTRVQEEQELKKGKIYLFVTENNILVKVLGGIGSTDLLLQSLNKEYKDLILKKDEIKEIWLVIAMMREF
jgi:phage repressor protein C with HTH and peptisase S24 domain